MGSNDYDHVAFIEDTEELLKDIHDVEEEHKDPPMEFLESVREKAGSMLEWAKENQRATQKMADAVENMHEGVRKWMPKDD